MFRSFDFLIPCTQTVKERLRPFVDGFKDDALTFSFHNNLCQTLKSTMLGETHSLAPAVLEKLGSVSHSGSIYIRTRMTRARIEKENRRARTRAGFHPVIKQTRLDPVSPPGDLYLAWLPVPLKEPPEDRPKATENVTANCVPSGRGREEGPSRIERRSERTAPTRRTMFAG